MTCTMKSTSPKHIFIFDMARTRSHLFFRFLSTHPDIENLWHPFLNCALLGPERITKRSKNQEARNQENDVEYVPYYTDVTYEQAKRNLITSADDVVNEVLERLPFITICADQVSSEQNLRCQRTLPTCSSTRHIAFCHPRLTARQSPKKPHKHSRRDV